MRKRCIMTNIKIMGVGGCGNNFISGRICDKELADLNKYAVNTDKVALNHVSIENKILIGKNLTSGLGAGGYPEIGEKAMIASSKSISNLIKKNDIVFIVAGFGGGTGTGASPVIANIARKKNAFTIGIITKPFEFEGNSRKCIFEDGLKEMQASADIICIIPNQNLLRIWPKKASIKKGLEETDETVCRCVKVILKMISKDDIYKNLNEIKTEILEAGKNLNINVVLGIGDN